MNKQSEAAFQQQVITLARTMGWMIQHTKPAQVNGKWLTPVAGDVGFPDLVLSHRTKGLVFAELKTEKGRLAPAQKEWRDCLQGAGAEWHLWRPDDLMEVMKRLSRAAR
jgi:hypothetical protein